MVRHGNRGKPAGKRRVKKPGCICLKLVDGSVCCNLPAESAKMRRSYIIYRTDYLNIGDTETERPRCFWIQIILPGHGVLAVNNHGLTFKQNDCTLSDCWYVSKVSVSGATTILV